MRSSFALLAFIPAALAHFHLHYPEALDGDEEQEGISPCGGAVISTNDTTDITVGGFQIAAETSHPEAQWLYRVALGTQEPFNWTNIVPVIQQGGIGDFCQTNLSLPSEYVGQTGVIQVSQSGSDGNLYQCAVVNFVEGTTLSYPEECTNSTTVTATYTTQNEISNSSESSASATGSAATASASAGSAVRQMAGGLLAMIPAGVLLL